MQIQSQTCWQLDSSSSSHHNISELCSRNEIWHIYLENNFLNSTTTTNIVTILKRPTEHY